MKILYHHRIGSKDGQYVHIEELVLALRNQGHEVVVAGPAEFDARGLGSESGLIAWLKRHTPGMVYESLELLYNVIDYARLRRVICRFQPDLIYERYNLYLMSGLMARRAFRLPLLLEVNAPLYRERRQYGGLSLPWLARWSERKTWRGADRVFTVTHVLAKHLHDVGVAQRHVIVTPNGINSSRFPAAADRGAAKRRLGLETCLVLGFVGFAREWHGLDTVIDLLATTRNLMDLHFLVVGDGPARARLERQAQDAGVAEQMTITGIVERDEIAGYTSTFDIALQPHVVPYASPLKLFEYMAAGSAIVAPSVANIREILTHEHDALLFDPEVSGAFGDVVQRLIEDAALRQRLGVAARQTLDDRELTWEHNACRVMAVASDVSSGGSVHGHSDAAR